MKVRVNFKGEKGLKDTLKKMSDATPIKREVFKSTLTVQRNAQKLVPILTGELRKSGMNPPQYVGRADYNPAYMIGYTAEYAVYVHEDLTKLHGSEFNRVYAQQIAAAATKAPKDRSKLERYFKPRRPQEQAQFLIVPGREEFPKMVERIKNVLKQQAR